MTDKSCLVLLSALMLFVELALIRWLGSNILYLSYFSNFVLLGCFLGIGVGFLVARTGADLFRYSPIALAFLAAFVMRFPVVIDRSGADLIFFGMPAETGLPIWITLPVIFLAVAAIMAMIGLEVARTFVKFEALEAYRLNILGSVAGIVAFSLLSFAGAAPVVWGLIVGSAFVILHGRKMTLLQGVGIVSLLLTLGAESTVPGDTWSPYYKISTFPLHNGAVMVTVNGLPHQVIETRESLRHRNSAYRIPYSRAHPGSLDNVLIIGAGTGNDAAIALLEGAGHVDAIEIDPRLYRIGSQIHPARPYDDPRVEVHIDDGRAFLERTNRRYDMILFALPDSLTLVAGQSSLRLESYLFTVEAMRVARDHLKPGGAFAMYNFYRKKWLIDRFAGMLDLVYGHPPCLDSIRSMGRLAVLTTSPNPASVDCPTPWQPEGDTVTPATDDRPFPYLKRREIPGFYLATLGAILIASVLSVWATAGAFGAMAGYLDLFFMGAAFLLLETKNVVQFALLFGTTWLVNALVFTGILLSVLAAVEAARRVRIRNPLVLYIALLAALAVAWAVPPHALLALSFAPRFLAATLIAFVPVFLANLLFAQRFREAGSSAVAFGANLLGAMTGGMLEYGALITGYRGLLIVVAVLYGLAVLLGHPHLNEKHHE